jgi:hypothetical protein
MTHVWRETYIWWLLSVATVCSGHRSKNTNMPEKQLKPAFSKNKHEAEQTSCLLVSFVMQQKEDTNDTAFAESNLHLLVLAMFLAQHYLADSTTSSTTDVMLMKDGAKWRIKNSKKTPPARTTRSGTEIW